MRPCPCARTDEHWACLRSHLCSPCKQYLQASHGSVHMHHMAEGCRAWAEHSPPQCRAPVSQENQVFNGSHRNHLTRPLELWHSTSLLHASLGSEPKQLLLLHRKCLSGPSQLPTHTARSGGLSMRSVTHQTAMPLVRDPIVPHSTSHLACKMQTRCTVSLPGHKCMSSVAW